MLTRRETIGGLLGIGALGATAGCSAERRTTASAPPKPLPKQVNSAQEAAQLVLQVAQEATAAGSYGIASALLENSTGKVVHTIPNRVVRRLGTDLGDNSGKTFPWDPTAHGERQMISWYYANREVQKLPKTADLTLVTSIDPCVMCTGTLLGAGINVAIIAPDKWAGINYAGRGSYQSLPQPLRQEAQRNFGLYGVAGGPAYVGGENVLFGPGSRIEHATYAACESQFEDNARSVRESRSSNANDPSGLTDPATGDEFAPIRRAYQAIFPMAFSVKVPDTRRPTRQVFAVLEDLVKKSGADNAVAFLDAFGNLVAAAADDFAKSPVDTCLLQVTQGYAKVRWDLVDDPRTTAAAMKSLTSPRYGTYVFYRAVTPTAATGIENLGIYGDTMSSKLPQPVPSAWQFYQPPVTGSVPELHNVISALPPLYSKDVAINPQRVKGSE